MSRYLSLFIFILSPCLSAQIKQQEEKEVARLLIVNNAINCFKDAITMSSLKMASDRVNEILKKDSLNYSFKQVYELDQFKLFLFVDRENIQLHQTYFNFLYNELSIDFPMLSIYEDKSCISFINSHFVDRFNDPDSRIKLIELYNIIEYSYINYTFISPGHKIVFLNIENQSEFNYLKNTSPWLRYTNGKSKNITRLYKEESDSDLTYYEINYSFENSTFTVYKRIYFRYDKLNTEKI